MAKEVRKESFEGVSVKVVSRKNSFDAIITIEAGAYLWHERKCECCWVRFATQYKIAPGIMRFKITRQGYDRVTNEFKKTFDMRDGGKCTISLYPSFVLPENCHI